MSFPLATRKSATEDDAPEPPRSLPDFIRDVREAAEFAAGIRKALTTLPDSLDIETIFETAQAVFEIDVIRRNDLKNHVTLHRLRQAERTIEQRDRAFDFSREKYDFDVASAVLEHLDEFKKIHADGTIAQPEKIEAVRQCLFGLAPTPVSLPLLPETPDEISD